LYYIFVPENFFELIQIFELGLTQLNRETVAQDFKLSESYL